MRNLALALIVAAAAAASVHAAGPSVGGSVSQKGLDYVMSIAIPMLAKKLANLNIPDISGEKDGFEYSITNIACTGNVTTGAMTIEPNVGIAASMTDFEAHCNADWSYKLHHWPHIPKGDGSVDGSMSNSGLSLTLGTYLTPSGAVQLNATSIAVSLNDFSIEFHGGITAWLLDILKDIFAHDIKDDLANFVATELGTFVNQDANQVLASISFKIPIPVHAPYNISLVDFTPTQNVEYETGYVGIDLLGAIENINNPVPPPIPAPSVPKFDSSAADHYLQFFASPYLVESLIYVYEQAGLLSWTVSHNSIPASFPVTLNTTWLGIVAPGLPKQYPNEWVDVVVAIAGEGNVTSDTAGVNVTVPLTFSFDPLTPSGLVEGFVLGCDFTAGLDVEVEVNSTSADNREYITGNLTYLECPLSVVNSTVGTVNPGLLTDLIDYLLPDVILPLVNDLLHTGLPLPTVKGLSFTDTEIVYGDGWVLLASDFVYVPPSTASTAPFPTLATFAPSLRGSR